MNLHYCYWVKYYEELYSSGKISKDNTENLNRDLIENTWKDTELSALNWDMPGMFKLDFKADYPGILSGLGYTHAVGKANKEDKTQELGLGFLLDFVTGVPYLPGSMVKGILRSAFMQADGKYVKELLQEVAGNQAEQVNMEKLEEYIFGNRQPDSGYPSIGDDAMGHDRFLDAFPLQSVGSGLILGLENITPHRAKDPAYQGLTEPEPHTLLKIRPGVTMRFRLLPSEETAEGLSPKQRVKLYQLILQDFGAGAKTNVGFGSMTFIKMTDPPAPDNGDATITGYDYPKKGKNTDTPTGIKVTFGGIKNIKIKIDTDNWGDLAKQLQDAGSKADGSVPRTGIPVSVEKIRDDDNGKPILRVTGMPE